MVCFGDKLAYPERMLRRWGWEVTCPLIKCGPQGRIENTKI